MLVTVRCFSTVRERVGAPLVTLEVADGARAGDVVRRLAQSGPRGADLITWLDAGHLKIAVNRVHADPLAALRAGDEVALFPPVSGG